MTPLEDRLGTVLGELAQLGRLRHPEDGAARATAMGAAESLGVSFVDASSNDYLGLGASGVSRETGVQQTTSSPGAGSSRLIHGTRPVHRRLERALADWVEMPDALLFTSGYAANLGLISALAGAGTVISDRLNHASIIDGCRLSRAEIEIVPHLDLGAVEAALALRAPKGPCLVVFESYFSMDGDAPHLLRLRELCDRHGAALVIDEAHALGVFGPEGAGRCRLAGVKPDALVGTMGKAIGLQGAFVAGSERLRTFLWNRARSFVFSTAPSPLLSELVLFHVERIREAEDLRTRLHRLSADFRVELANLSIPSLAGSDGPIVPVLVGDDRRAVAVAERLLGEGILTQAIRPPTVPEGTARLRFTVASSWPDEAPRRVARSIRRALAAS